MRRDDSRNLSQRQLSAAIERQRDQVIDLEAAVNIARGTVNVAVEELHAAVRERDRAIDHLQRLVAWHDEERAAA